MLRGRSSIQAQPAETKSALVMFSPRIYVDWQRRQIEFGRLAQAVSMGGDTYYEGSRCMADDQPAIYLGKHDDGIAMAVDNG